jgi:amino acid permease
MTASTKKFFSGVFMLSGTIIGASFLALPYIAIKTGLFITLGYLVFLTIVVTLIHWFYAEVAAVAPDFMRLPSYARMYLGKTGKIAALFATLIGFCGTLLAYIIIGSSFLNNLLSPFFNGNNFLYAFLFFLFGAIVVFFGVRAVSKINFLDASLFFLVLVIVSICGWHVWKASNLFVGGITGIFSYSGANLFLPYGVILSALWGATVIPEIEDIIGKEKKLFQKIIPWGTIAPAIFYFLFILVAGGIAGEGISPEAAVGLKKYLPPLASSLIFLFGLIVVFTSYISISLALRNTLRFDFQIRKKAAWGIACFVPFLLYLIGFRNFIGIIGFVGSIALAIEGILIILMYNKVKNHKWITLPLILLLVAGMLYEILYFFR